MDEQKQVTDPNDIALEFAAKWCEKEGWDQDCVVDFAAGLEEYRKAFPKIC